MRVNKISRVVNKKLTLLGLFLGKNTVIVVILQEKFLFFELQRLIAHRAEFVGVRVMLGVIVVC